MNKSKEYQTPTNTNYYFSTLKTDEIQKRGKQGQSFAFPSEFTEEECSNLKNQIHILEEKIKFIDKEFQIKVVLMNYVIIQQQSYEKKIQSLNQATQQLNQQKNQYQLQASTLLQQGSQLQQDFQMIQAEFTQLQEKQRQSDYQMNKLKEENENLKSQNKRQGERSKKRKEKCKKMMEELRGLQMINQQLEQELDLRERTKSNQLKDYEQQLNTLQEQNEEIQINYSQLLQNFKNQFIETKQEQENAEMEISNLMNQNQQFRLELEKSVQNNEEFKIQIENSLAAHNDLEEQLVQLLEWIQDYQNDYHADFKHPLVIQIQNVFSKVLEYNLKLSDKKTKWKQLYHERQNSSSRKSAVVDNSLDQQVKLLCQKRVMELEQFYSQKSNQTDRKIVQLKNMLNNYFECYIESYQSLRLLNNQITESQRENQVDKSKYRKVFWVVIFTIRLTKMKRHSGYRKLIIDMPILKSIQQFLQLVTVQQQIIKELQSNNQTEDYNAQEIREVVEKELKNEIENIQGELEEYKEILAERELESQEIIEQKNAQLQELLERLRTYEETFSRQENRIRMVENELKNLGSLMQGIQ